MAHVQDTWYSPGPDGKPQPTSRHGRGRRYKARWIDLDGRERSKSFPDRHKGDADRFLVEIEHSLIAGTYLDPDAGRVTLRRRAREWLDSRTGDPTTNNSVRQRVNKHIVSALGDKRLDQLARSPSTIQAWVAGLQVAPSYARQLLGYLSAILDAAVADSLIPRNPCRDVTVRAPRAVKRKVVPLTAAQAAALRAALPLRFRAMCDCGTDLGQRQGEIFGLAVEDVDFLRRVVHVRAQVKQANGTRPVFALPKGGKTRDVPLPRSASLALAEHIRQFPPRDVTLPWRTMDGKPTSRRLVFTGVRGSVVDRWSFNRDAWKPALRTAGIPVARENGMHVLRHTFASALLRGGIDVRRLAEWLGHSMPAITLATYSHLMPGTADKDLADIEAALAARREDTASALDGLRTARGVLRRHERRPRAPFDHFIRDWGAVCVTGARDVIEVLSFPGDEPPDRARGPVLPRDALDPVTRQVLEAVPARTGSGPARIAVVAGVGFDTAMRCLGALAAAGFVERGDRGWRIRRGPAGHDRG